MKWLVASIASLVISSAEASTMYNFKVASWQAGAYSNDATGRFSHCAASASYNSGIVVLFSITRNYSWSMGFANPQWRLTKGQQYNIAFTVDAHEPVRAVAEAIGTNLVNVPLADSTQLFELFRRGRQLRVAAAGQVFTFNLTNTSQLLPTLIRCVASNVNPAPPPTASRNPFVAPAPMPTAQPQGSASRRNPNNRAEAVAFVANVLSKSGQSNFKILDDTNEGEYDAAWISDAGFGVLKIAIGDPRVVSATTIAMSAATCKDKFASGAIPASGTGDIARLFTKCGEGKDAVVVYFFLIPRKAGGVYLLGTGTVGSDDTPARKAEDDIRRAALIVNR